MRFNIIRFLGNREQSKFCHTHIYIYRMNMPQDDNNRHYTMELSLDEFQASFKYSIDFGIELFQNLCIQNINFDINLVSIITQAGLKKELAHLYFTDGNSCSRYFSNMQNACCL